MSEIPEDIMDKAHLIWQDANTVDGVFTGDGQSSKYIPIIARAILAERERCAKIADVQEAYHLSYGLPTDNMRAGTANMIACAIRHGVAV